MSFISSAPPSIFVVMGVSGCGKSTVGQKLAAALGVAFVEGDDFHPAANVAKMAAGIALNDADREGWLQTLAARIADAAACGQGLVLSCSALKRAYRDRLRLGSPQLRFIYLHGERDVLAKRMAARTRHYMPPSLLDSQLATLEPPGPGEGALTFGVEQPLDTTVAAILQFLSFGPADGPSFP